VKDFAGLGPLLLIQSGIAFSDLLEGYVTVDMAVKHYRRSGIRGVRRGFLHPHGSCIQRFDFEGHYLGEWTHLSRLFTLKFSRGALGGADDRRTRRVAR
jgi:hypothetical protein